MQIKDTKLWSKLHLDKWCCCNLKGMLKLCSKVAIFFYVLKVFFKYLHEYVVLVLSFPGIFVAEYSFLLDI